MKNALHAAALLALALQPAFAAAQLAPVPNAQEYLNYLNPSSAVVSTGLEQRVYVGPYQGRFEDSVGNAISSNFALYCVDYHHYATLADGLVNAYGVDGSLGDGSTTRLGTAGAAQYLKTAYLASLFETVDPSERQETWSALHAAMWWETNGVANADPSASGAVYAQAMSFYQMAVPDSFTGAGWYVLTGAEARNAEGQEFLIRTSQYAVPEPGTVLLMLTGIFLLAVSSRRRLVDLA